MKKLKNLKFKVTNESSPKYLIFLEKVNFILTIIIFVVGTIGYFNTIIGLLENDYVTEGVAALICSPLAIFLIAFASYLEYAIITAFIGLCDSSYKTSQALNKKEEINDDITE